MSDRAQPAPESASGVAFGELAETLSRRRLIVVSGKGGVGRTTVAALLGAALAEDGRSQGRRVLVATTGHDDRLAWMLGAERLEDQPREVSPGLWIQRLVPATCIEEYGALVTGRARLSHAVFGNKAVRRLMRAIPGLDDFAILGKAWHVACRARDFDTLIFDGPASGHLRLVLGVPRAIVDTVAEGPLTREAVAMVAALEDPEQTAAVLVGLPESWPLTELGELAGALRGELNIAVDAMVINQMRPLLGGAEALGAVEEADPGLRAFADTVAAIEATGLGQRATVQAWLEAKREPSPPWLSVPWWPWGVDNPERLAELLAALREGRDLRELEEVRGVA